LAILVLAYTFARKYWIKENVQQRDKVERKNGGKSAAYKNM